MAPLIESLARIASRVELVARGVDGDRVAAERMLEKQRHLDAREHARSILSKVPDSPLGLALWADAAEGAWLDHEAVEALTALAQAVPWRADVWLRLGRAGLRTAWPHARDALERAAAAPDERASARRALLDLCDLDLAAGDPGRALRWLDRVQGSLATTKDEAVLLRRVECALALGRTAEAASLAEGLSDTVGEGSATADPLREEERSPSRRSLVFAKIAWARADGIMERAQAVQHALRAFILDAPGSRELLATIVSFTSDAKTLADIRAIVAGSGQFEEPSFMAAFAFAEGRRDDARAALVRAVERGDALAVPALARIAIETRDVAALTALVTHAHQGVAPALVALSEAERLLGEGKGEAALTTLEAADGDPDVEAWADALRTRAWSTFVTAERADWPRILDHLMGFARDLGKTRELLRIEGLGVELERPIVACVVGEFNAGKSTFINAFLGVDVAPTGILPTTATLHRVAWAADRFARVILRGSPDRVVPHEALKATLSELQQAGTPIERVQIYAPIERLRWVEILDTPGFNAPNPEHARAAKAAFDEVHAVLWLLDATGPLKASEAEILKEVDGRGLPIIVLLNKVDRLSEADLARVLEHTNEGLAEIGLKPVTPPLPFSAKLALAGRLGDEAALERSRWATVEESLGKTLVDQADALRERALRRRAARLAGDLADEAAVRAVAQTEEAEQRRARASSLRSASARLYDRTDETAAKLSDRIEPALRALTADLRPLAQLSEGARDESTIVSYAAPRAVARLARPISDALGSELGVGSTRLGEAFVAVALEGCVVGTTPATDLGERTMTKMLTASVRAFASALAREAADLEAQAPPAKTERRLRALCAALLGKGVSHEEAPR